MHRPRRTSLHVLVLLFVLACSSDRAGDASQMEAAPAPTPSEPVHSTMVNVSGPEPQPQPVAAPDEYAGWSNWCEPMYYESQCETDRDCSGQDHPALRGAPLKCLHPWWARDNDDLRICAPGGSTRTERRWRTARLRELVSELYFDEAEHCSWTWEAEKRPRRATNYVRRFEDGRGVGRQHWRCQREWQSAEKLTNFLAVPYQREVGKRPYKRHRLPADQEANAKAYVRQASAYGWVVEIACEKPGRSPEKCPRYRRGRRKGKRMTYIASTRPDPGAELHNSHYDDRWRWEYGLGPFGANAALGVQDWDRLAPPEVLCLEVPAVEAYLRDARGAVRTYRNGGVDCDGQRYRGTARRKVDHWVPNSRPQVDEDAGELVYYEEVAEPSWMDVHRVASGGAWCPRKGTKAAKFRRNLKAQLRARGVDPDEPVTEEMLGHPLDRDGQWDRARAVLAHLDDVLPSPWNERTDESSSSDASSP